MLKYLKISNLAVIDKAEFDFGEGFCVLTGETGAGKSLVVGAIELLLGGRSDSSRVRTGEKEAVIEGVFVEDGVETIVRRKISESGRSYAWLNDLPVTIAELKDRTAKFADLLGQHEHQILLDPEIHIEFLDIYGGHKSLAEDYKRDFQQLDLLHRELKRLNGKIDEAEKNARLREYEIQELEAASLDIEEYDELNSTMRRIESSETILENANEAYRQISGGEQNAISNVVAAQKKIDDLTGLVPECEIIGELLETALVALEEAAREIDDVAQSADVDSEEAERMRCRQMALQRLCRKYNRTMEALIEYREELKNEAGDIETLHREREELKKTIDELRETLAEKAIELSMKRQTAAPELSAEIAEVLAPLSMDKVIFEVNFTRTKSPEGPAVINGEKYALLPTGIETAEFYISTNPGEDLRPLANIVSGGELSRIMLALKTLFIEQELSGMLVFDEVDTGIGGDIGRHVGRALANLAKSKQLLVITHLPQIARLADSHYVIYKYEDNGRTRVRVGEVSGKTREGELERMHGWEMEPSQT